MSSSGGAAERPGMVTALGVMTLANGVLNILYAVVMTSLIVLGTFFLGIVCAPITVLPAVLGVFEILFAIKVLATPARPVRPSPAIAVLEICCLLAGNVVSVVVGIFALVFYADPNVKAHFTRINAGSS